MLPLSLLSTYRQYKQDTDFVASWLATTAKSYGYPSDLLNPAPSSSNAPSHNVVKYTIALKDFIPLAEWISSRKPPVLVPDVFATVINRVIKVRSEFPDQLNEHGGNIDLESDDRHSFFVGILEKVRDVLRTRMPTTAAETMPQPKADTDKLTNLFDMLKVYEPSEGLDTPTVPEPSTRKPSSEPQVVYEAEQRTSLEDALVAYTMLMNDLSKIRARISWIWSNYRTGLFDAAAAAIATNSAIDIARNLMEEMLPIFKQHGAWSLTNKFYLACCLRKGYSIMQALDEDHRYAYDVANDTYLIAFQLLISVQKVLDPNNLPLYKDGLFGEYDPSVDRERLASTEKFVEDRILIMEMFTELVAVTRMVANYPVQDEFTRGIAEMAKMGKTGDLPFYLVFAGQIFLDIHHCLRADATRPFQRLMNELSMQNGTLSSHLKFHEKLKISNWPASNDVALQQMMKKMAWIQQDPVYLVKVKTYTRMRVPVPQSMEPNRMLRSSPVLAGLLLYHFRTEIHDVGIAVANAWGSITYPWHLYNALRSEKMLARSWSDMDVVHSILGDANLHVGSTPQNPNEYFTRFCLQMGVSASAFADPKKRRRAAPIESKAGPRGIKTVAPVSYMFADRYLRNTGLTNWTAEQIDEIVSKSEYDVDSVLETGVMLGPETDQSRRGPVKKPRKKAVDGGKLEVDTLIQSLTFALQAESLELAFPWLMFHRHCWILLRLVKECCDELLRTKYGPTYMEKESELPWVVGYIFMAADGIEGLRDMRLMQAAAEAFNSMLESQPDFMIRIMGKVFGMPITMEGDSDDSGEEASVSSDVDGPVF
ncbi:hypothetical protein QBC41DRAFT_397761 [Cercophora samala]|uniref:DUF6604 domain-containing protein n=1 Tax=Cercophora samala TaxID=330535 RepID=A0AA39ZA71_9PEZI|nr:hypothetical protein QBC41DRAFT_397761 [Cercophora samala]